jgi:hypothetical protein
MDDRDPLPPPSQPTVRRNEPPLIERARRMGWALLSLSLVAAIVYRLNNGTLAMVALVVALALALFGLLAIGNVMLVRALYAQVDAAAAQPEDPE